MKKGYWVVAYKSLLDETAVKAYGALALAAVESFCGRLLTQSTNPIQSHEAGLPLRAGLSDQEIWWKIRYLDPDIKRSDTVVIITVLAILAIVGVVVVLLYGRGL